MSTNYFILHTLAGTAGTDLASLPAQTGGTFVNTNIVGSSTLNVDSSTTAIFVNSSIAVPIYYNNAVLPYANYAAGYSINFKTLATSALTQAPDVYVGADTGLVNGYAAGYIWNSGTPLWEIKKRASSSNTQVATASAASVIAGSTHSMALSRTVLANGHVFLALYIDGATTPVCTYTDSSSPITQVGFAVIAAQDAVQGQSTGTHFKTFQAQDSTPFITQGNNTGTAINLSCASPVGTASIAWYRGTTFNFTPGVGNVLAGQTSQTLSDSTAIADTTYYYYAITTDGGGNTFQSPPQVSVLQSPLCYLGIIGDSIEQGGSGITGGSNSPGGQLITMVQNLFTPHFVGGLNQALGGTATADWLGTGTNLPAAITNISAGATALNVSSGNVYLFIRLDANDAKTAANVSQGVHNTNMLNISNYALTHGVGKVLISCTTGINLNGSLNLAQSFWTDAGLTLMRSYRDGRVLICNGSTIIKCGDGTTFDWQLNNQQYSADGTHQNIAGAVALAERDLGDIYATVGTSSGGGGGSGAAATMHMGL